MCSLQDPVSIFSYVTSNGKKLVHICFHVNMHVFASMLCGDVSTVPTSITQINYDGTNQNTIRNLLLTFSSLTRSHHNCSLIQASTKFVIGYIISIYKPISILFTTHLHIIERMFNRLCSCILAAEQKLDINCIMR